MLTDLQNQQERTTAMNFCEFREKTLSSIRNYLPEEFRGYRCEVKTINKINGSREAIIIQDPDMKYEGVPNLYLDDFYEMYRDCRDMDLVMSLLPAYDRMRRRDV